MHWLIYKRNCMFTNNCDYSKFISVRVFMNLVKIKLRLKFYKWEEKRNFRDKTFSVTTTFLLERLSICILQSVPCTQKLQHATSVPCSPTENLKITYTDHGALDYCFSLFIFSFFITKNKLRFELMMKPPLVPLFLFLSFSLLTHKSSHSQRNETRLLNVTFKTQDRRKKVLKIRPNTR